MVGLDRRAFLGAIGVTAAGSLLLAACGGPSAPPPPAAAPASGPAPAPPPANAPFFVGTYTDGEGAGKGIGVGTWATANGQATLTGVVPVSNPSFLALGPGDKVLYAVDEQEDGGVSALAVSGGQLTLINRESSKGAGPTHLCVHPSGHYVLAANYDSGSVVALPVRPDGGLGPATDVAQHTGSGPDKDRQEGPHAHQIVPAPAGGYLHAVDLGTDTIYAYQLDDASGRLTPRGEVKLRAGSGPRHLAFHPNGRFAYVTTELGNTVVTCAYANGVLTPGKEQPATVPSAPSAPSAGGERNYPAEVVVSSDGRFVYVSNRGADNITVFAVGADGQLTPSSTTPCGGKYPRYIGLARGGDFLFSTNQKSDTVTSFAVDRSTGALTSVGKPLASPMPVCALAL
jgi:6-phosphogluconolactonase